MYERYLDNFFDEVRLRICSVFECSDDIVASIFGYRDDVAGYRLIIFFLLFNFLKGSPDNTL